MPGDRVISCPVLVKGIGLLSFQSLDELVAQSFRFLLVLMDPLEEQIRGIVEGRPRAIARALSVVENEGHESISRLMRGLYPHSGGALVLGVTGSPGAGKSTLVDQLARLYRKSGKKVGIIAVDPTSPFTGGAILGDRIRMQSLATDPDVFIRSMATRGRLGGLSAGVLNGVVILDAAGYELVLVETVGVGQDEVDIAKTASVTLVVLVPGMGDDIQTIKAGIMEIADIFVINKADREGVAKLRRELENWLAIGTERGRVPPILETVASTGEGVEQILVQVPGVKCALESREELRKRRLGILRERVFEIFQGRVHSELMRAVSLGELDSLLEQVQGHQIDPYTLADRIYEKWRESEGRG